MNEEQAFINMAHYVQLERGYKESWCYVIFKEKYGKFPNALFKTKTTTKPDSIFLDFLNKWQSKKPSILEKKRLKPAKWYAEKYGVSERTIRRLASIPRADYLANSINRIKPWEDLGMSRSTWYRRGKPAPPQPKAEEPCMNIALTETTASSFVYTPKVLSKTSKYRAAVLAGAKTTTEIITAFNAANQSNIHPINVGQAAARLRQVKYNGDLYHPLAVSLIKEDLLRLLKRRQSFEPTPPQQTQENTA